MKPLWNRTLGQRRMYYYNWKLIKTLHEELFEKHKEFRTNSNNIKIIARNKEGHGLSFYGLYILLLKNMFQNIASVSCYQIDSDIFKENRYKMRF